MKQQVGLWIDHKRAVIVTVSGETETITHVASNVEKHIHHAGVAPPVSAGDLRDKRFSGHLNKYYDEVISSISDVKSILIFGPGEAKGEFAKRLQSVHLGGCIVGIETVDKMTEHQIAARVRQQFAVEI